MCQGGVLSLRKKLLDTFGAQVSSDHERYPADVKCLGFLYLYVGRYPRNNASRNTRSGRTKIEAGRSKTEPGPGAIVSRTIEPMSNRNPAGPDQHKTPSRQTQTLSPAHTARSRPFPFELHPSNFTLPPRAIRFHTLHFLLAARHYPHFPPCPDRPLPPAPGAGRGEPGRSRLPGPGGTARHHPQKERGRFRGLQPGWFDARFRVFRQHGAVVGCGDGEGDRAPDGAW